MPESKTPQFFESEDIFWPTRFPAKSYPLADRQKLVKISAFATRQSILRQKLRNNWFLIMV